MISRGRAGRRSRCVCRFSTKFDKCRARGRLRPSRASARGRPAPGGTAARGAKSSAGGSISRSIRGPSPRGGSRLCPRRGRQARLRRAFPAPPSAPAGRSRRAGLLLLWVRRVWRRSFCFPAWLSFPGTLFAKRFREWGARGRLSPALVQQGQNFLKILRRGRRLSQGLPLFCRATRGVYRKGGSLCEREHALRGAAWGVPRAARQSKGDILLVEENIPFGTPRDNKGQAP